MNQLLEQEEDLEYENFVGEDQWEDEPELEDIKAKYPESWFVVKVVNFTERTLADVKQWCQGNCEHAYDHVGWYSGCSYMVGVAFEHHTDAVMFRLVWGS